MFEKILYLDSSATTLNSFKRVFRKKFDIVTETTVEEAIAHLENNEEFSVIISTYRLNGHDGIDFLTKASKLAPLSVKVIITEQTDMNVAIRAVNECDIFRFLIKPTPQDVIENTLIDSVKQYKVNRIIHDDILSKSTDREFVNLCSFCKKVRLGAIEDSEDEVWEEPEIYFSRVFNIKFLQGICPECVNKLYSMLSE